MITTSGAIRITAEVAEFDEKAGPASRPVPSPWSLNCWAIVRGPEILVRIHTGPRLRQRLPGPDASH